MKTTNNANLNKMMELKSNKTIIVSMEKLDDTKVNQVLESIYNGTVELKTLLNVTDRIIDMTKCENPITVMQKIYKAGSDVGKTTTQGQNMYMLDVTTDNGFKAFKDSLKMLKDKETHVPYESVWIEGINMFSRFCFATGQYYVFYVVTSEEMRMLQSRIEAMSKSQMTVEDAQALQADLPPFIRAWQESSIDVSKDKDKVFAMFMEQFFTNVSTLSQLTKKFKDSISFGFDTIKKAKRAGKIVPKFAYSNDKIDKDVCVDLMGHVSIALQDTAVERLNGTIHNLYKTSDNSLYAPFINDAEISKELALYIKSIFRICYAARTENKKISKEEYALLRDVIYTAALNYGVDKEDVIRIAIATAMTSVTKNKEGKIITKDADVNRFSQYPVSNIFPDEYVNALTGMPIYDELNASAICSMTRDIADNEEIEFVDGVSVDGTIELFDFTFTGTVVENEGKLLYFKDIFAFNVTNALVASTNTFKETATKEQLMRVKSGDRTACDHGEFLNSIIGSLTNAKIAGANANLLIANKHFLCQFDANYAVAKGDVVEIANTISYVPDNGVQQIFMFIVK